jgi:hypothetical protein
LRKKPGFYWNCFSRLTNTMGDANADHRLRLQQSNDNVATTDKIEPTGQASAEESPDIPRASDQASKTAFADSSSSRSSHRPAATPQQSETHSSPALAQGSYYGPGHTGSFGMGGLGSALPDFGSPQAGQHYQTTLPLTGAPTPAVVYQLQQNLQFPQHTNQNYSNQAPYVSYVQPTQYAGPYAHPSGGVSPSTYGSFYPQQQPQRAAPFQQHGGPFGQPHVPGQYYYYQEPYAGASSPTFVQSTFMPGYRGGPGNVPMPSMDASRRRESVPGSYSTSPSDGIG